MWYTSGSMLMKIFFWLSYEIMAVLYLRASKKKVFFIQCFSSDEYTENLCTHSRAKHLLW